jgi:WXG100 family type VII secretion target
MTTDTFGKDLGALSTGADRVNDAKTELDDKLKALRGYLEALGTSSFDGRAAVAFRQVMTTWDESSTKLVKVLIDFEGNLRGTERDADAKDEEFSSAFAKFTGRLGQV